MDPIIYVLYDSITNSVFESQVLTPLLVKKCPVYIISFERDDSYQHVLERLKFPSSLTISIIKRTGCFKLKFAQLLTQKLSSFGHYRLIARGPLAALLCWYALNSQQCTHFTIQARGLLAQEFRYTHRDAIWYKKIWYRGKTWIIHWYEKQAYQQSHWFNHALQRKKNLVSYAIECVSPALKKYVIQTFNAKENAITIATDDIPHHVAKEKKLAWRAAVRTQLNVKPDTEVYCYAGSAKTWQCPQEIIKFFAQQYHQQSKSFLLILTQDIPIFEDLVQQYRLPKHAYKIMCITHKEIYRYLAAADNGILFREPDIINWVSRPTKLLEYHAVDLGVIHNDTVAYCTLAVQTPEQQ